MTFFRFFKMEVLAGESNLYTSVKQDGCIFEFDFSKVYWNSRLQTEHSRLVEFFDSDDVVCDMFAGVGPFAIPAAKKGCTVYGNDLNPASYEALLKNAKLNRVEDKIHAYNMDGRDFVRKLVQLSSSSSSSSSTDRSLQENGSKVMKPFTHVVMNLPASAVEFVDVFRGLYSAHRHLMLPMIHCYCFSKSQSPGDDAKEQVERKLGSSLTSHCSVHCVRDVAPKKVMVCVSFKLPESVAFGDVAEKCDGDSKRQRDDSADAVKDAKQAKLEL
ncbi:tRNA (guanine(37)-N1)-methyltransferase [Desmophyllum pertusum]|uniref:tRNA (Guanine(37)-N1)-methyltransferase n=1 Tax=Desmophyllum pertusum TaxID=174260 RepID=A0A9W9YKL9_9CNID|nr:tRNA (guanine(37)-N1)-methyltransferase [Desmophyllum pertusum]